MGLFDRKARDRNTLDRSAAPRDDMTAGAESLDPKDRSQHAYYDLKGRIHRQLIDRLDLSKLEALPREVVEQQIRRIVEDLLALDETPLSRKERDDLVIEIEHETFGLGPIEPLMQDPTISDILVNGSKEVYVERHGKLEPTRVIFRDDAHLLQVIDRIVSAVGRRVDESSPMVDARLPDGSRVNAIIPPLALDGPVLSIRRFAKDPFHMADLIEFGTLTPALAEILRATVQARLNILVSGGTGAGKTTLLNVLSNAIPNTERIVTIEDSAELQLQQEHVVRLETRPPNIEGQGAVNQRELVRNALRMRPDRIVVGEVRGPEVLDMLQAMNTGHDGSLSTVHANSTRDALSRIETMVLMSGLALPVRAMRDYIASALDLVVHVSRLSDGTRKVTRVTEIVGMEEDVVTTQDIFTFEQQGIEADGRVVGFHRATGVRPKFSERLARTGIHLGAEVFDPSKRHAVR
jgi:pilus assembly protein CpaF